MERMDSEKITIESLSKGFIRQKLDGTQYVLESDLEKLNLTESEERYIRKILKKNQVRMESEKRTKKNRSSRVKDLAYGEQKKSGNRKNDIPVEAEIEYDEDQILDADYSKLDQFIEERLIPEYIQMKQRKTEKEEKEYYPSIQLKHIIKFKFSEDEIEHILNYLEEKGIRVAGTNQSLDSEFENYDYIKTYKTSILPESLSKEEIKEKFAIYEVTRDPVIREQLILGNMRLVPYLAGFLAKKFGANRSELEQSGYEGLIKAVDRYRCEYNTSFSSFAIPYIKGEMLISLKDTFPYMSRNFLYAYLNAKRTIEEENNISIYDSPEYIDEIVDLLIKENKISPTFREENIRRIRLLNSKDVDEEWIEVENLISLFSVEDEVIGKETIDTLKEAMKILTERQQKVLTLRFGLEDGEKRSLEQTAKIFHLNRETIRQIEKTAILRLRHSSHYYHSLKDYSDIELLGKDDFLDTIHIPDFKKVSVPDSEKPQKNK